MEKKNVGSLLKETLRIAWPAVLESFFISLAGMIDTAMVSELGTYAIAATGLTAQPKFITLSVFFAINVSVSALVARRRGQNDQRSANNIFVTALLMSLVACVIMTVASVAFADPIIDICGSSADTHAGAVLYFRVIQAGMIFNVLSMVINATQRGCGNTRIAMTTNVTSSIVNIIFNYLLITGKFGFPRWELFGAAFATVLGTVAASVMSVRSICKPDGFVSVQYIWNEKVKPAGESFLSIVKLGTNMLVENLAMRVGFVATAVIAAKLGTDAFAAHQVGMNFLGLGFSFGDGMQVAAVALIGRSLGEKRTDLAKTYGNICQLVGLGISVIFAMVMFFGGEYLFGMFFDEPEVLQMGILIGRFIIVIVLFQISQIIFGGCLRGAGDVKFTLIGSLISVTLIRTVVTYVLTSVLGMGLVGIWLGVLSDQLTRFVLFGIRFKQGKWVDLKI